jgi:hypothetical protein
VVHHETVTQRKVAARTGPAGALILEVEQHELPGLRVEIAGRGLLALRQNDSVVLMAHVHADRFGVEYASTGRFRSPIPPIRTARTATLAADTGERWQARWARHFATALTGTGDGPLHTGRWVMSAEASHLRPTAPASTVADRWAQLLLPADRGWIDWFVDNGAWQVLPLRPLAEPDAGRVKSYRKQARDGILAPVLLWWISGLDCYVVLDGHDRLVAALAENTEPPLLAISSVNAQQVEDDTERALSRYARSAEALEREVIAGSSGSADALAAVNRQLAENLRLIQTSYGTTRAWQLRGGSPEWNALAAAQLADWHANICGGS